MSSYLDESAREVAGYVDQQGWVRYTHPQTPPDDTLHALNYALRIAHRLQHVTGEPYPKVVDRRATAIGHEARLGLADGRRRPGDRFSRGASDERRSR